MKKVLTIAILLSGSSVFAQHQSALSHFTKTYPTAEDVYWDEYDDYHEASFLLEEKDALSRYNLKGQWIETATSINDDELPASVKNSLAKVTSIDNVSSMTLIEKADGSSNYEINVDTESESFTLIYNKDGALVKKIDNQEDF